jgi:hypothetical protein|tara:strand:- start:864 stop:1694 length:831 start_codon:yes stop_codon:yes gene_type:complete
MSSAFNKLADPAYLAGLKQDDSSYVHERTTWPTQPTVTNGASAGTGTVTIDINTDPASVGDVFLFSGGHSLTITTGNHINTPTSPDNLTGTVSGTIANGEKLISHQQNILRFTKVQPYTWVKRSEMATMSCSTNWDSSIHGIWTNGSSQTLEYWWHYSSNINPDSGYTPGSDANYATFGKKFNNFVTPYATRLGQSYSADKPGVDFWNIVTSSVGRTTTFQVGPFGSAFDRGVHEEYPDRKGGYWWVEAKHVHVLNNVKYTRSSVTTPMFFLEIQD